ncbi:MAG: hypothetical protein EB059_07515 [Alphaproteobacteria bacterium]|nr:hypothetical protein [Alphaproteobacteria bacterium]
MSDKTKSGDKENKGEFKYPHTSFVEELGATTAEAICANMRAANDDAPSFGPSKPSPYLSSSKHLDPETLANALTQLRKHAFPTPFFKNKFMQKFRVIMGNKSNEE